MKKKYNNKPYQDLSKYFQKFFANFGFFKIEGTGKPYYAGTRIGKVFRVVAANKLKEMKDNATPTRYGYLKLRMPDGTFKTMATHRIMGMFIPNPDPEHKSVVNHLKFAKNRNAIDELAWASYSENYWYSKNQNTRRDKD